MLGWRNYNCRQSSEEISHEFVKFMLDANISIMGGHLHQAHGVEWLRIDYLIAMNLYFTGKTVFPRKPCSVFLQVSNEIVIIIQRCVLDFLFLGQV